MNYNVGIDLININELDKLFLTKWFIKYFYDDQELSLCADFHKDRQKEFLVGRFCAKEAVYKAIGGIYKGKKTKPEQILILRDSNKKPVTKIKYDDKIENINVSVSISHKGSVCIAIAIYERSKDHGSIYFDR